MVRGAASQRAAEGQIADTIGGSEPLIADLSLDREEAASEARMRPGRAHSPSRAPGVRGEGERGVSAKVVGEIDDERLAAEVAHIQPGEEAPPIGTTAAATRLKLQRTAICRYLRVGTKAPRIA